MYSQVWLKLIVCYLFFAFCVCALYDDEEEYTDELDELINERPNPPPIRNQAENDYVILEEDSVGDSFFININDDDVNVSVF